MDMAQTPLPIQLGGIQVVCHSLPSASFSHATIISPSFPHHFPSSLAKFFSATGPWALHGPSFPEEFISGCLRLQGAARAVDLLLMTKDTRRGAQIRRVQLQH